MTINDFLTTTKLNRLDAELILCATLNVDRTYLAAHGNEEIGSQKPKNEEIGSQKSKDEENDSQKSKDEENDSLKAEKITIDNLNDKKPETQEIITIMANRRLKGEPLAYILGHKEFYGRKFLVDSRVLIPRPETEQIIELALETQPDLVIDVGTGSGAIAITLNLELNCPVFALDLSAAALDVAKQNAKLLKANDIIFMKSNLLSALSYGLTIDNQSTNTMPVNKATGYKASPNSVLTIVANLPYVDRNWDWISKTTLSYEPELALYAKDGGLFLIKKLLDQIQNIVFNAKHKYLILEADPSEHNRILEYAKSRNFSPIKSTEFGIFLKF